MTQDKVRSKSIDDTKYGYDSNNNSTTYSETQYNQNDVLEDVIFLENPEPFIPQNNEDVEENNSSTCSIENISTTLSLLEKSINNVKKHETELEDLFETYLHKGIGDYKFERKGHFVNIITNNVFPPLFTQLEKLNKKWYIEPYTLNRVRIIICLSETKGSD